jgi:hypothetical protein
MLFGNLECFPEHEGWSPDSGLTLSLLQAALNFTPISENGKQKLQEKVAPSQSAWEKFLRTHEDSVAV